MKAHFDDIERQARLLPLKDKAARARLLIEELDQVFAQNITNRRNSLSRKSHAGTQRADHRTLSYP